VTVPPAAAPTAKGAYGSPDSCVEANPIDFEVRAGSKEKDLRRKAAENVHRQAQAGVAEFQFILGEGAWFVGPSPWPVIRQSFSIPVSRARSATEGTATG
jgi:hypothetical protein